MRDGLGVRVFEGAADELEQRRPFGVIADCLASGRSATERGRAAVARLLGEDSGVGVGGGWLADAPQAEFRIVAPVRQGLHFDAGRALAGAGAPAERVAEQLLRGASPGDTQAVAWLQRAAHQAAPRAPAVAVELLGRALELAGPTDPARDGLLAAQAVSLMWCGRLADAEGVCRAVLARTHDPDTDATLRLCLVQTLLGRGRIEEALEEMDAAVASQQLSAIERVRLQAFRASALASLGQLDAAAETAARVRPAADSLPRNMPTTSLPDRRCRQAGCSWMSSPGRDGVWAPLLAGERAAPRRSRSGDVAADDQARADQRQRQRVAGQQQRPA
jgi:tetratricopeptide (TPR) repeat protein